ncbi:MAG: HXXEE domain-containing protein [Minisyncoccota bacterium]
MKSTANIIKFLKLAIPLFIVHAIEEYSTGLLDLDPIFRWVTAHNLPTITLYWIEQIILVALLVWTTYRPNRWFMIFIGLLFIFEITHIIPALRQMSYYPGLVTAVPLLLLGLLYWRELIKGKEINYN